MVRVWVLHSPFCLSNSIWDTFNYQYKSLLDERISLWVCPSVRVVERDVEQVIWVLNAKLIDVVWLATYGSKCPLLKCFACNYAMTLSHCHFLLNASTYIAITLISLVLKRGNELNVFALLYSPYQTSTVLFVLMKEHVFRIWQGLNVHI